MTLSIKDHIDQGHYPLDEKGRALVPMGGGRVAVIYASDHPDAKDKIIGCSPNRHLRAWKADGSNYIQGDSLLPPASRKVVVTMYYALDHLSRRDPKPSRGTTEDAALAKEWKTNGWRVVTLTGEYEEPWA